MMDGPESLKNWYLHVAFGEGGTIARNKKSKYILLTRSKQLNKLSRTQKEVLEGMKPLMIASRFPTEHIRKTITINKMIEKLKQFDAAESGVARKLHSVLLNSVPRLLDGKATILRDISE